MKIKYLGTAAAEGIPAMFCDCNTCRKARELGERNVRTRSQAIINDKILVDFNADTFCHSLQYKVNLVKIRNCVITHIHEDHYYADELMNLFPWFAHVAEGTPKFRVFGSEDILTLSEERRKRIDEACEFVTVKPFETFEIEGIKVTPLKATHGTKNPYIYMFEENGKSILYAHDTGNFSDETWDYLIKNKPYFNLVSLDCTEGNHEDLSYENHMCIGRDRRCAEKMKQIGLADEKTKFIVNHFSHNGKDVLYDDMCMAAEQIGFEVSYDGMEVEV